MPAIRPSLRRTLLRLGASRRNLGRRRLRAKVSAGIGRRSPSWARYFATVRRATGCPAAQSIVRDLAVRQGRGLLRDQLREPPPGRRSRSRRTRSSRYSGRTAGAPSDPRPPARPSIRAPRSTARSRPWSAARAGPSPCGGRPVAEHSHRLADRSQGLPALLEPAEEGPGPVELLPDQRIPPHAGSPIGRIDQQRMPPSFSDLYCEPAGRLRILAEDEVGPRRGPSVRSTGWPTADVKGCEGLQPGTDQLCCLPDLGGTPTECRGDRGQSTGAEVSEESVDDLPCRDVPRGRVEPDSASSWSSRHSRRSRAPSPGGPAVRTAASARSIRSRSTASADASSVVLVVRRPRPSRLSRT